MSMGKDNATSPGFSVVTFSYFDPFEVFDALKAEIELRLPFQNLHWKPIDGTLRTIRQLPVRLIAETSINGETTQLQEPFIMFLIVSCSSIDEYRAKVRPLVRQWLSGSDRVTEMSTKRIILLRCNLEVLDSNLFKTISLIEKFAKDFPQMPVIEMKTIYKSEGERREFWTSIMSRLGSCVIEIFQERLKTIEDQIRNSNSNDLVEIAKQQEQVLRLYLAFSLQDEASNELKIYERELRAATNVKLPTGRLEIPFSFENSTGGQNTSIASLLAQNELNTFQVTKFFFLRQLELIYNQQPQASRFGRLYAHILSFLTNVRATFLNSANLHEFEYYFLDNLISLVFASEESGALASELEVNLKLLQRDVWLSLVYNNSKFRALEKRYQLNNCVCSQEPLKKTFQDEETFQQNYLKLTKEIISLTSQCSSKRQRTADLLSVDVALMYYQMEDYENAIGVLTSCFEYYKESEWNVIGTALLERFVDCLIKCPDIKGISIEDDDEKVPTGPLLRNSILNLISASESGNAELWDRFVKTNNDDMDNLVYPLENLFDVKVDSRINVTNSNVFVLKIMLTNVKVTSTITSSNISVLLKNHSDEFLRFEAENIALNYGENSVLLGSTKVIFGTFELVNLGVTIGNTSLSKDFGDSEVSEEILVEKPAQSSCFDAILSPPQHFDLSTSYVTLNFLNEHKVSDFSLELTILEPNKFRKAGAAFDTEGQEFSTVISDVKQRRVVFYCLRPIDKILIRQRLSFKLKANPDTEFFQSQTTEIRCKLPITVSVEDILKGQDFYFKFLLNAASTEEPILVHSTELTASNDYLTCESFQCQQPLLLNGDESSTCFNFFRVKPKDNHRFNARDVFSLNVQFNTMRKQLEHLVTNALLFQGDIDRISKLEAVRSFWDYYILPKIDFNYRAFQDKSIVKLRDESENVQSLLKKINEHVDQQEIRQWMRDWLKKLISGVKVDDSEVAGFLKDLDKCSLNVTVNLPPISQSFEVELNPSENKYLELGNPTTFYLSIRNLAHLWIDGDHSKHTYVFELLTSSDWLVNGRRKFSLENQDTQTEVVLLPLKRGRLNYPRIEIYDQNQKLNCVYFVNMHETLVVI
ncbi:LAMI_0A04148g1_1 [Lachancea mirantina]|uniref:LAMI_0A04148g1_1 n=1 Tax=Lachancea mirantina TaxID=1230905 RepID=A0A1G4INV4_9SACH|nr:LAMI_0A04148g1_1 [Lachancea mirantina]